MFVEPRVAGARCGSCALRRDTARSRASGRGCTPEPKVPTEKDLRLAREARTLLDQAFARGAWTAVDAERLRQLRQEESNVDWLPFMRELAQAANEGRMKPRPPRSRN
jgi:hypothetical protein